MKISLHFLRHVVVLAALIGLLPATASAAENEIVYRANLGSAADVALLIANGTSPNTTNDQGVPILLLAAARTDTEGTAVVKAILDAGADVNDRDWDGKTALFYAGRVGNKETAQYLLERGADYYALDNQGHVVRTALFELGREDIVAVIDNYANGQAEKVRAQRVEYEKIMNERRAQAASPPAPPVTEAKPAPQPAPPAPVATIPAESPEEIRQKEAAVAEIAQQLSFDSCAFQYWYFCREVKKSTEFSTNTELDDVIDSFKEKIAHNNEVLLKDYNKKTKFIDDISLSSKQRIFNILDGMPSNIERHSRGVGKTSDMEERCSRIAKEWEDKPIIVKKDVPPSEGSDRRTYGDSIEITAPPTTPQENYPLRDGAGGGGGLGGTQGFKN